jgi:hypothetical protein
MRHTVRLAGVVVGYSELEDAVPASGVARGKFRPGLGYELVQPVFRLFTDAIPNPGGAVVDEAKLRRYHQSRDALGLVLHGPDDVVVPTSAIHIADYADQRGSADRDIEVLIADEGYWQRRGAGDAQMSIG